MGDLGRVLAQGDQAGIGEFVEHAGDGGRLVGGAFGEQAGPGEASPGVFGALPDADHAQQDEPGGPLPFLVETLVDALGGLCDRVPDAAAGLVSGQREQVALALLPGGEQGERQQRQRPAGVVTRLPARRQVAQQQIRQALFQDQAGDLGGFLDRLALLVNGHRSDHHLAVPQRGHQLGVGHAVPVEVGPHPQDNQRGWFGPGRGRPAGRAQGADECPPLLLVLAGGEQLFELVHHQDHPPTGHLASSCPFPQDPSQDGGEPTRVRRQLGPQRLRVHPGRPRQQGRDLAHRVVAWGKTQVRPGSRPGCRRLAPPERGQ